MVSIPVFLPVKDGDGEDPLSVPKLPVSAASMLLKTALMNKEFLSKVKTKFWLLYLKFKYDFK